jgi:hypothetical protein
MSLEVSFDDVKIDKLLRGLEADVPMIINDCLAELGEATFSLSQQRGYVPVRKGTLKKSGYRRKEGKNFVLGYAAPYAAPQEYGSRPHIIKPRKKKFLHWSDGSGEHFAKEVHHPGNRPVGYIRRSWLVVQSKAPAICKPVIERHIAKARD